MLTPELIEAYRNTSTATISDNLARLPGTPGLLPYHRHGDRVMVGRALTVWTRAGDNAVIHQALGQLQPGDVLVVDGGGDESRALVGEIMAAIARSRGAAGMVIDGAIRDAAVIGNDDFPCFARAVTHRGPYKSGPGHINVPVSIAGMVVNPGDLIVGDADGVVAVNPAQATELLVAVLAQEEKEREILLSIRENRYVDAYSK